MEKPVLNQLNIVISDFGRSADFYRRLGVAIAPPLVNAAGTPFHATGADGRGAAIELDNAEFARRWNPGWAKLGDDLAGRVVLGFTYDSREEVDRIFLALTEAGYAALAEPHDAFWGSRYSILQDPNGIAVGLMSPADPAYRSNPPQGWGSPEPE